MIDYARIKEDVFEIEGSLRDIYVLDTTNQDWQALLDFLRQGVYPYEFLVSGESRPLPGKIEDIFVLTQEESITLRVDGQELALNCHFFISEEIEFDLDPRNFQEDHRIARLHGFMCQLGSLLNKIVILTDASPFDYLHFLFRFIPENKVRDVPVVAYEHVIAGSSWDRPADGMRFPGFQECMRLMREPDLQLREDSFYALFLHVREYVAELREELTRERDLRLCYWLLELLGETRDPGNMPLLLHYVRGDDLFVSGEAVRGLERIDKKVAHSAAWDHFLEQKRTSSSSRISPCRASSKYSL